MDEEEHLALSAHFDALRLNEYYVDESVRLLSESRASFYAYYRKGGREAVSSYLDIDGNSSRRVYGVNHWKPCLLLALAADDAFCDGGFRVLGPPEPF